MLHQPSGAARGQASDMNNEAKELLRIRSYLNKTLANSVGKPVVRPRPSRRPLARSLSRACASTSSARGAVGAVLRTETRCKTCGVPCARARPRSEQETVAKDISRDKYFTPDSAVEYGVIDRIIYPRRQKIAA